MGVEAPLSGSKYSVDQGNCTDLSKQKRVAYFRLQASISLTLETVKYWLPLRFGSTEVP